MAKYILQEHNKTLVTQSTKEVKQLQLIQKNFTNSQNGPNTQYKKKEPKNGFKKIK